MRLFQQERAIYEATELLEDVMRETGVTRTELAKRLGKSKGWVTQLLDGEANKTIRTIADAFAVLGREFHCSQRPIQIGTKRTSRTAREKGTKKRTQRTQLFS
jgi:transcriptional regulator with XRE-family HTH domain